MSQEDTHLDAENTNNPTGCSLQPTGTHDPSLIPPISLLPVELLVKIIHATHTSASSVRKDHPVCDLPSEGRTPVVASLLMSHVCQRWRYAALASPELWANIAVRANTSMTFLDFIWAHIGDVPVSIDIKLPWNSGEEVHALIGAMVNKVLANPDRLRSLTAVISEQNFGQLFRSFPNTLGNLEHLDLAICQYGGPRPGIMDPSAPAPVDFTKLVMNIRTPNLSSIELSDEIAVQWSSPLMQSPHLTHFVGSYGKGTDNLDGGDLYRMLARCQHLRELSVRVKYFSRTDSEPTIFSHTPMDLSNIVVLELFAYDWFLVRDLLHSIRIPMRNLKRLRVSLPNHQPPMPTEQFWNALRIASSNNVRLTPETLCVDGFRITSMVWTSTKASDGQLSNGKQPTFRFIVDSSTPSRLFKEPDEYQAIWGFETLRSLEIQGTQIPESVWCVLVGHQRLEHITVNTDEFKTLLTLLDGTFPHPLTQRTIPPFPSLRTLVVSNTFWNSWLVRMWVKGPFASSPEHGPHTLREYPGPDEDYVIPLVSALVARAQRFRSSAVEDEYTSGMLDQVEFRGFKDDIPQNLRDSFQSVVRNLVWVQAEFDD